MDKMDQLKQQIEEKRKTIRTDGYSMSIGEWLNMYENNELDIHPEFQRFYRWKSTKKTHLIESILLGIPLPPIFVSTRPDDGVWDVVDGLQRLSTIFEFAGVLKDADQECRPPLKLEGTKYLSALEGTLWNDPSNPEQSLPMELRLSIKRSKIPVSIILGDSDKNAKYDLFERLNTGGDQLSDQEVRNCLLVMLNKPLFEWLKDLPKIDAFEATTNLTERAVTEAYDVELALRFILLAQIAEDDLKPLKDIGDFLTDKMTALAKDNTYEKSQMNNLFVKTFTVLDKTLQDNAFRRYSLKKERHEGGFLISLFETIALGVAFNLANETLCDETKIAEKAKKIWDDKNFVVWTKAGTAAASRLPKLIPYGRDLFRKA